MKRKVHLYGRLKNEFGGPYDLDVSTAGEAIRCLQANFSGFLDALQEGQYEVVRGDAETGMRLELDDINSFQLGAADLHFIPVIGGEGSTAGTVKIILGVALAATAMVASGGTLGAALPLVGSFTGMTYGNLALLGGGLALAGVSTLLSPKTSGEKKDESYTLTGPTNNYEQGNAIPLIYGRCVVGSVLISSGVDIEELPKLT